MKSRNITDDINNALCIGPASYGKTNAKLSESDIIDFIQPADFYFQIFI